MIRFLPIVIPIIALIVAAVAFRIVIGGKVSPTVNLPKQTGLVSSEDAASQILNNNSSLLSSDQRISIIEEAVKVLAQRVNNTTAITTNNNASVATYGSTDDRLQKLEVAVTDIQTRLATLEKVSPTPVASSKYPLYITLGAGGSMIENSDWVTQGNYDVTINPASYPGYSSMQLEVNMRLVSPNGTIYAQLYNNSDGSVVLNSGVSVTSSNSATDTSATFTLPSGSKSYQLQVKVQSGFQGFVNFARIKVNF